MIWLSQIFDIFILYLWDAIYAEFVPQKVRAVDALAEIPKAEETWSRRSGIDALYNLLLFVHDIIFAPTIESSNIVFPVC